MHKMPGGDVIQELDIAYKRDRDHFFEKLQDFHKGRGTPFQRIPTFGGQPLDLYALYNTVISFGGICVVTEKKKWGQVFRALGFPPCTNAAYALKQHYARYLEVYERIFFLGEDTEDTTATRSYAQLLKYRRLNKAPKLGPLGEPLVDNFNRISFSLQSGLQNEVDFALNICSLLSNVPNSIFNLAKSPAILELMLGHVGIWSKGESDVKQLYDEWYAKSEKDFVKFWRRSLSYQIARDIYEEDNLDSTLFVEKYKMDEKNTKLFVDKDDDVEVNSPECCRVNQVCIILYNFSFEQMNAMHLASHNSAIRFLLMSSCCKRNNVQRAGLDALDNIAKNITLEGMEHTFTQRFLQIMDKFLNSKDKFRRCRAMSILAKLASKEVNKPVLTQTLSEATFKILIETLYLPDIALILASLDTLYCFTSLDEIIATGIAKIHGSIDVLVCLVTVRAETYGNKAIKGYRIIENKHSMFTPKNQQWLKEQEEKRRNSASSNRASQRNYNKAQRQPSKYPPNMPMNAPPYPHYPMNRHPHGMNPNYPMNAFPPNHPMNSLHGMNPNYPMNNLQMGYPDDMVEIDAATYTANWMSGYYEPHPSNMLYTSVIYDDYISCCKDIQRQGVLDLVEFIKVLRSIIPPKLAQILPPDNEGKIAISGILRRKHPMHVQSKVPRQVFDPHHPMKPPSGPSYPLSNMPLRPQPHMPPYMQPHMEPHMQPPMSTAQMLHSQIPQSPRPSSQIPYSQMSPQMSRSIYSPSQMPPSQMPPPQMPPQIPRSQMPSHMPSQMPPQMPPQLLPRMPPQMLPQLPHSQMQQSQMASQMPPHMSSQMPPRMSSQMPPRMSSPSPLPPQLSLMPSQLSSQLPPQISSHMPPQLSQMPPQMSSQMPPHLSQMPPQTSSQMPFEITSQIPHRLPSQMPPTPSTSGFASVSNINTRFPTMNMLPLPNVSEHPPPVVEKNSVSLGVSDDCIPQTIDSSKKSENICEDTDQINKPIREQCPSQKKSADIDGVAKSYKENENDGSIEDKHGRNVNDLGSNEDNSVPIEKLVLNESEKFPNKSDPIPVESIPAPIIGIAVPTESSACPIKTCSNPTETNAGPNSSNPVTRESNPVHSESNPVSNEDNPVRNERNPFSNPFSKGEPGVDEINTEPNQGNHAERNSVQVPVPNESNSVSVPDESNSVSVAKGGNPVPDESIPFSNEKPGVDLQTVADQKPSTERPGSENTIALGFSKNLLNGENLSSAAECQELIEKLKTEMQAHFMQFHMHRQHIQAIQMQIQQLMQQTQADNLPRNVIKNIQMRVQTHHVQMQSHYQRLQQLNALSEQVQSQLLLKKTDMPYRSESFTTPSKTTADPSSLNTSFTSSDDGITGVSPSEVIRNTSRLSESPSTQPVISTDCNAEPKPVSLPTLQLNHSITTKPASPLAVNMSPRSDVMSPNSMSPSMKQRGQQFIVPPPFPYMQNNMVSIQHGIPNGSFVQGPRMMSPPPSPLVPKATKGPSKGANKSRGSLLSPGGRKAKTAKNSRLGRGGKKGNNFGGDEKSAFSRVKQGNMMNGLVSMPTEHQLCSPFQTATGTTPRFPQANAPQVSSPVGHPYSDSSSASGLLRNPFSHPLSPGMIPGYPSSSYGGPSMNNSMATTKDSQSNDTTSDMMANSTSVPSPIVNKEMHHTEPKNSFSLFNGEASHKDVSNGVEIPNTIELTHTQTPLAGKSLTFKNMNGSISGDRVQEDSSVEVKKLRDLTDQLECAPKKKRIDHAQFEQLPGIVPMEESPTKASVNFDSVNKNITVGRVDNLNLSTMQRLQTANFNPSVAMEKLQPANFNVLNLNPSVALEKLETTIKGKELASSHTNPVNMSRTCANGTVNNIPEKTDKRTIILTSTHTITTPESKSNICTDEKPSRHLRSPDDEVDFVKHDDSNSGKGATLNGHSSMDNRNSVNAHNNINLTLLRNNNLKLELHNSNQDLIGTSKTTESINNRGNNFSAYTSSIPVSKSNAENIVNLNQPLTDNSVGFYSCKWELCKLPPFRNVTGLLEHMIQIHAPVEGQLVTCKVPGCSSIKKPRRVMISHFQEKHCLRKNKDGIMSSVPLPKMNVSKDSEWKFEDESPVTRSVRHTAALILRNIARISSYGKKLILRYEDRLTLVAISTSEAASGAAECLLELSKLPVDINDSEDIGGDSQDIDGDCQDIDQDSQELYSVSKVSQDTHIGPKDTQHVGESMVPENMDDIPDSIEDIDCTPKYIINAMEVDTTDT